MSRPTDKAHQPALIPAESVEAVIMRIGAMKIDELRSLWRETFGAGPPTAFSKEFLARAIAYRLQEDAYGGLKAPMLRLLRAMARPEGATPRRVKVGSVIVREHKGLVHEVMVVPEGFCWRGQTFDSLSTIAKRITGVSWSGPRFFGLRVKKDQTAEGVQPGGFEAPPTQGASPGSRASSKQRSPRSGRRSSIQTRGA
jgi:hypothetical protein